MQDSVVRPPSSGTSCTGKAVAPPAKSAAVTSPQRHQLDWIAKTDPRLWRAYLLKEGLRDDFAVRGNEGKIALDRWIEWARRYRISAFVHLQRRIVTHRAAIHTALDTGLSQGGERHR